MQYGMELITQFLNETLELGRDKINSLLQADSSVITVINPDDLKMVFIDNTGEVSLVEEIPEDDVNEDDGFVYQIRFHRVYPSPLLAWLKTHILLSSDNKTNLLEESFRRDWSPAGKRVTITAGVII